jgi:hypothetical protein
MRVQASSQGSSGGSTARLSVGEQLYAADENNFRRLEAGSEVQRAKRVVGEEAIGR